MQLIGLDDLGAENFITQEQQVVDVYEAKMS